MPVSVRRFRLFPVSIGQAVLWAFFPTLLLLLIIPDAAYAQVVTNITPTTIAPLDLGTNVDTVGTTTEITGGTRPGSGTNLFHSFDLFTLGTGDTANFLNDMQLPTTNIFGRVIGGEVSTIDGTLRTNNPLNAADPMNFGAANLWLVNPSGLLLGPNARIEVGGSVSMSTVNYLGFEGTSARFDMLASPASLGPLSVAPVSAFGFLSSQPAPMTVVGGILQVPVGQSISLVGGDIAFQAHDFGDGIMQAADFRAQGGQLNLVSVASPGEVLVPSVQTGPNINGVFTTMGTVTIKDGVGLDVSGQVGEFGTPLGNGNSGTVLVRGGQLVMDASTMQASTVGAVDSASTAVDIQVSQDVTLSNGSAILTLTSGPGRAGDVQITAGGTLTMESAASIFTGTLDGDGIGGDVVLNVGTVRLMDGASIQTQSQSFTPGFGRGGNVTIAAESVSLSGDSSLSSQTFGSGEGGRVAIMSKSLTMEGVATTVSTTAGDVGRGGDIVVGVQQASLSGGATITSHTILTDLGAGEGGTVTVQGLQGAGSKADSLTLAGVRSGIIAETFGTGLPGNIEVQAKTVSLTDGAVIEAGNPLRPVTGGNVTIDAASVGISGGSHISSQSAALDAGRVTVTATALTLDKGSIETNTSGFGNGGDVLLNVGNVSLSNGSTINSSSVGFEADAGNAGNVTITSSGAFASNASTIVTSAENARAGTINVTAQSVALSNGTLVSTSSNSLLLPDGGGNAGNLTVQSGSTMVMNNSSMTAEARHASGGKITITAPEMVWLINSQISTSVGGSLADIGEGDITIDPQFVILQNSQILARAFGPVSGNIIVNAGVLLVDPNSLLDASGSTRISTASSLPVSEVLSPLSQEFSSAAALLLASRCAADPTGQFSSFVQTGREGVPQIPGALSPSPLSFLEPLTSSSLGSPAPNWAAARLGLDPVRVDDTTRFYSACRS